MSRVSLQNIRPPRFFWFKFEEYMFIYGKRYVCHGLITLEVYFPDVCVSWIYNELYRELNYLSVTYNAVSGQKKKSTFWSFVKSFFEIMNVNEILNKLQ